MSTTRALTLDLGGISLPTDVVTNSNAILGKKGSGKTSAGIVLLEEVYALGVPVVSIDPKGDHWGVRSGADGTPDGGLPIPVFGGLHADVPLDPSAGEYVADLLRAKNLSAVLDVSEFSTTERRKFLTAFVTRLYRRAEREPMHLLIEEAHEVVPQRVDAGDAPMVGAFERLVKMGRFKGIGVTMLSQRSASLNKNVLTQVDNLFMLRTVSPQDRAAVKAWVETHSESSTIIESLPTLATGECWLWQPERGEPVRFRFRMRHTYDAGTTPKVGETPRPPATLADIDLAAIESDMAATIDRARQDDPKTLRRRIVDLERQLATKPTSAAVPAVKEIRVEVPTLGQETLEALDERAARLEGAAEVLSAQIEQLQRSIADIRTAAAAARGAHSPAPKAAPSAAKPPVHPATPRHRTPTAAQVPSAGDDKLSKAQKAIATALATHGTLSLRQIGLHAGYAHKSGSFANNMSSLRTRGFIEGAGQSVSITDSGLAALDANGGYDPLPTGRALVDWWLARLPKAQAAMLSALLEVYPDGLTADELGAATGYASGSGSFANNRSKLNVAELIHGDRNGLFANDTLGDAYLAH